MKKILHLALASMLSVSALAAVGCKKENKEQPKNDKTVVLADFEEWAPDFQLMAIYNKFGKVTQNENADFVKSGNYSAKLQPVGGFIQKTNPLLVIPTASELFDFSYADFTYYDEVSAYLYNDTDEAVPMTMGITSGHNDKSVSTVEGQEVILAPRKWTRASYLVDVDFLNIAADPTAVSGIYFQFNNSGVMYPNDAPTIYLDDVTFAKAEAKREPQDVITLNTTQEGNDNFIVEICDFEKPYQKYAYKVERGGPVEETIEAKVVNASEYGIEATSGDKVLYVLRHGSFTQSRNTISIPESIIKKTGMQNIPEEEWASTYLCIDVYNAHESFTRRESLWTFTEGRKGQRNPYSLNQTGANAGEWATYTGIPSTCGKWSTFKISLYELSYGFQKSEYVKTPGDLMLGFDTYYKDFDWEMFLDNFRLEKGEKLKYVE